MKTQIFKPLTEEKKCMVRKFFKEWVTPKDENWNDVSLWKLFIRYWRMRAKEKIQWAEEMIEIANLKKQDAYKWRILWELKRWIEDMKNNIWWTWWDRYELANIKRWADGRTMLLWLQDYDKQREKVIWRNWVLIEENQNPKFFKEMLEKYQPKETTLNDNKPF